MHLGFFMCLELTILFLAPGAKLVCFLINVLIVKALNFPLRMTLAVVHEFLHVVYSYLALFG